MGGCPRLNFTTNRMGRELWSHRNTGRPELRCQPQLDGIAHRSCKYHDLVFRPFLRRARGRASVLHVLASIASLDRAPDLQRSGLPACRICIRAVRLLPSMRRHGVLSRPGWLRAACVAQARDGARVRRARPCQRVHPACRRDRVAAVRSFSVPVSASAPLCAGTGRAPAASAQGWEPLDTLRN